MEDILSLDLLAFLNIKDCENLARINKNVNMQFKSGVWNLFLFLHFEKYSSFIMTESDIFQWMNKNKYLIRKELAYLHLEGNQVLHWRQKKWVQQYQGYLHVLDYLFPIYQKKYCIKSQIYLNFENKLSKWDGYYFEMSFPNGIGNENVQIGFAIKHDTETPEFFLGWSENSIGFHTDDRKIYQFTTKLNIYESNLKQDEIFYCIGAGIKYCSNQFFFTVNGRKIFECKNVFNEFEKYIPICSGELGNSPCFNDGKTKFLYDIVCC